MQLRGLEYVRFACRNWQSLPTLRPTDTRTRRIVPASAAVPRRVIGCLTEVTGRIVDGRGHLLTPEAIVELAHELD